MQFRDLKEQYKVLKNDIDTSISDVLSSGNFIMGNQVAELEAELADYVGIKHCVTCANGTDALYLAMLAWQIKEGDAVFIPDFTFFSSAEVVAHAGATPIFLDVDKHTYNIDTERLEEKITETIKEGKLTPKVIVAVDLFGLPVNFKEIKRIAEKYNLLVLEDAAQGFGGSIDGKTACSFGDISTTSFFPAKPLGCYGDGGAIFTDNDEWDSLLRSYRVHGKGNTKYDNIRIGLNSRLDTIQAGILQVKLKAFKEYELAAVNEVAKKYTEKLKDFVSVPVIPEGFVSSWAQYTIQLKSREIRNGLQQHLKDNNIPSMVYYQKQMHLMDAFDKTLYDESDFPVTNTLVDTVLSLPMHPYMRDADIDEVVDKVLAFIK